MDVDTFAKVSSMMRDAEKETLKDDEVLVVSSVSMKRSEKARLTRLAKDHGMSLSAFLRIAADEYAKRHNWE